MLAWHEHSSKHRKCWHDVNILPSSGQGNNNSAPPKRSILSFFISFLIVFNHLTIVSAPFCGLTKGITPNICWLCAIFYVFGSCFRTLAVILVSVFFFFFFFFLANLRSEKLKNVEAQMISVAWILIKGICIYITTPEAPQWEIFPHSYFLRPICVIPLPGFPFNRNTVTRAAGFTPFHCCCFCPLRAESEFTVYTLFISLAAFDGRSPRDWTGRNRSWKGL